MYDKKAHFDPVVTRFWKAGYADGYEKKGPAHENQGYVAGYTQGLADRKEDEEAIASGTFDLLTPEERLLIFGPEEKVSDYRD